MPNLGLILVDEEHDSAYKNQEGCRYSARDLAIVRAKQTNIPIVLSSATPSLETWQKAELGKYQRLCLLDRPGQQPQPTIRLIDVRYDKPKDGMSEAAQRAVRHAIDHGQQALVFLNRRGYSPSSCAQTADGSQAVNIAMQNQRSIASPTPCGVITAIIGNAQYRSVLNALGTIC